MKSEKFKFYHVGGSIRDEMLGLSTKDYDYSVVCVDPELLNLSVDQVYKAMNEELEQLGFTIFVETPNCFTTRAKSPKDSNLHQDADFVLSRKELGYKPGTRQPIVEVGTIKDDLDRRDFTVNAIARCVETGEILDFHNGQQDLKDGILRCVGGPERSFNDDPLRIIRAIRFIITKGFYPSKDLMDSIYAFDSEKMAVVSVERIMNELQKCFKYDTLLTLAWLSDLEKNNGSLYGTIMKDFWLLPTNKKK